MTTINPLSTPNLVLNPSQPRNEDPFGFSTPKTEEKKAPHRFSAFDTQLFASYQPAASPATAKRALEAHLSETDRRLEEASKLGTALVQQRQDLTDQLKKVEEHLNGQELGPELRQKLAEVEKEYNELGRETARAFLAHKPRATSGGETPARSASPTKFSSQATDSPSKMSVPSRKQRNQATDYVGDMEFFADITNQLLSQVRQLQVVLAERDESVKTLSTDKSKLVLDNEGLVSRLRTLDENEQKYKDENWSLETQTHELMAAAKESATREQRLQQSLALITSQKTAAQKELDDVRQAHGKMSDDFTAAKKSHDAEASGLRKNALVFETERTTMQKRLDELTIQNQELVQAMSGRFRQSADTIVPSYEPEPEEFFLDATDTEHSPPPSPTKGASRNSMLESETLKSSLNHAHRMIQSLKSNIHREKTEKLQLQRMLSDTRDELERRRSDGTASKKPKTKSQQDVSKKSARIGQLGAVRQPQNSIEMEDAEWLDHEDKSRPMIGRALTTDTVVTVTTTDAYQTATEAEDQFETADEAPNESELLRSKMEGNNSGADLTETEEESSQPARPLSTKTFFTPNKPRRRGSFKSTASSSEDEGLLNTRTPILGSVQTRGKSGSRDPRSRLASEEPSASPAGFQDSPASFVGAGNGQSLFAELEDMHNGSEEDLPSAVSSLRATPVRGLNSSFTASPSKLSSQAYRSATPDTVIMDSEMGLGSQQNGGDQRRTPMTSSAGTTTIASSRALGGSLLPVTPVKNATDSATQFSRFNTPQAQDRGIQPSPFVAKSQDAMVQASRYNTPKPQSMAMAAGTPRGAPVLAKPLVFSTITTADIKPITPSLLTRSASQASREGINDFAVGAALGRSLSRKRANSDALSSSATRGQSSGSPISTPRRQPSFKDLSPKISLRTLPSPAPNVPLPVPMADTSVQTTLSAAQLDNLLRLGSNSAVTSPPLPIASSIPPRNESLVSAKMESPVPARPGSSQSHTYSFTPRDAPYLPTKSVKRPGSSHSANTASQDSTAEQRQIPAATAAATIFATPVKDRAEPVAEGSMGPPTMTAAAYRAAQKKAQRDIEPATPVTMATPASMGSATPKARYSSLRNTRSRKSSVSSFESEMDARFNIRPGGVAMGGWENSGATDPRMIQAITQTMIGEYLWKYTRKAGRSEMSDKRHRRFFWVHPYTRTLYWSAQDPSTAGRAQLKANSVAIEAVRVVADDNPMPPGLHRKSLVVITPGRDIKFTATTGQRHETWFNALSYLLLRNSDGQTPEPQGLTAEDIAEFNPRLGQSQGRASRTSLSTYNSRTNTTRRSFASIRGPSPSKNSTLRAPVAPHATTSTRIYAGASTSMSSRISNLWRPNRSTSALQDRPPSSHQGSIYNASVVNDSAEDVRKVLEKQDKDADTLENVRACCDGKHDVGSLSHRSGVQRNASHRH